jgi:glycosyltransferase involved in cell wall biosynthesis
MTPKISYLISTYNSGEFLDRHLYDLLKKQTDPDFEVIIVNPASPGTDEFIAKKWEKDDARVKYIYHPVREPYGSSWLRAWEAAKAPIVVNSNTDDFHHPDFTKVFSETMFEQSLRSDVKVGFCYAGICVLDEETLKPKTGGIKPPFDFKTYSKECWGGPQLCWRNDEQFRNSLNWPLMWKRSDEHRSAFDYWLALYFMSLGNQGYSIQQILTYYTQRAGSIENSNTFLNNYETFSSIAEFFPYHFKSGEALESVPEFANFNSLPNKEKWISDKKIAKG